MSQAPHMMLKPQQIVTALRIIINPLRTMVKVPRITLLYRLRIMLKAHCIMSQAPHILLNVSSTAYNIKSSSYNVVCTAYIISKSLCIMLKLEAPHIM